jgi:hypothetical protein
MSHFKNDTGTEITFLDVISVPFFFIYEIEIKNTNNNKIKVDLNRISSNAGYNALNINIHKVAGYDLLSNCDLKSGESIICYIAFQKYSIILTNKPTFVFDRVRINIRHKDIKKPKKVIK